MAKDQNDKNGQTENQMDKKKIIFTCSECARDMEAKRTPRGWKRINGELVCGKCVKAMYVLRAITFPVASPINGEWKEFREALKKVWSDSTALANWLVSQYYANDIQRTPDMETMPKMPKMYFYPEARKMFPDFPSTSVVALDHSVSGKYGKNRFDLIWLASQSISNYRYPVPFPVHNKSWRPEIVDDRPVVKVRIGGKRWELRLRNGKRYARQMSSFKNFVSGDIIKGELAIYRKRANNNHRNGVDERDDNDNFKHYDVMVKMVGYFPRSPRKNSNIFLNVHTQRDKLLVASMEDRDVWVENCDQVLRWTAEHARQIQRWSEDQKAEQRPTASYQSRRDDKVRKYKYRMDSLTHEVSAHLVKFALRRRVGILSYDDSEKGYCDQFQWYALREKIESKCHANGIEFIWANKKEEERKEKAQQENK